MKTKVILCRRKVGPDGHEDFCCKPIKKSRALEWCEDCRKNLPLWPAATEPVAPATPAVAIVVNPAVLRLMQFGDAVLEEIAG